jgi:putative ABC transport system permease protein
MDFIMKIKNLINFATLNFHKDIKKNIFTIFIFSTIIFVSFSYLFLSDSLKHTSLNIINKDFQFIVQKVSSGKNIDTPKSWIEEYELIDGIKSIECRVYGKYWYEMNENYFTIIGVDVFSSQKEFEDLNININSFLEKKNMIISTSVKKFLDFYEYKKYYTFRNPKREVVKVYIYDYLPKSISLFGNDIIIMETDVAKEILGIKDDYCSDIVIKINNILESDNIKNQLIMSHFDSRIIDNNDLKRDFESIYDFQNSIFFMTYFILFVTFLVILYDRYSSIYQNQRVRILILRSLGFNITDIIFVKIVENLITFIFSFLIGIFFAYIYVFLLNAPLLLEVFLGHQNLSIDLEIPFYISTLRCSTLFFIIFVPFVSVIILTTWKTVIK